MRCLVILSLLICFILCYLGKAFALSPGSKKHLLHQQYTHTVDLRSLLPATTCTLSTKGNKRKTSLELVHKHGPCSHLPRQKSTATNHTQILERDQARVNSINSRLSKNLNGKDELGQSAVTSLPSRWATSSGASNYIVTVGLGTPKKQLSLIFDTGSYITWTQCQPCVMNSSCYQQNEPIFDPAASTSYSKIPCSSSECNQLETKECSKSNTCIYVVVYGDNSHTAGYFSKDKLTITSDVFDGFLFGCGQENVGFLEGPAGLLGLSRDKYSVVEQTADKYSRSFSYCLPPTASSTGFLSFGTPAATSDATITYTKLVTFSSEPSFYGLDMVGINVNGRRLSIPSSVFSSPGTIIDSGTVISWLPSTAFNALNEAFKAAMTSYPSAPGVGILKTCYDFSGYSTVKYPKIEFVFGDGVTLTLDATGIVYLVDERKVCLAFAGNENADDYTVFGNTQQKNMEVFYDVAGERVGFAPGGC